MEANIKPGTNPHLSYPLPYRKSIGGVSLFRGGPIGVYGDPMPIRKGSFSNLPFYLGPKLSYLSNFI